MDQYEIRQERTRWFQEARFGLFIHWGLYAIPARGEWVRSVEKIDIPEYQPYFDAFNPTLFDPRQWARAARQAGMKYAVMTAKHHDGFCLFDSALTDYKSTKTQCGRDLIREYLDAFRAEGLKVGVYYSLLDWYHPGYPAYDDANHPMRGNEAYKGQPRDFDSYVAYLHGQVRELCTNYGKIDIIWFDFSYDKMTGEKWQATRLVEMVRSLQPGILIDNRLAASGSDSSSIRSVNPPVYAGDFASPEQIIPPMGVVDEIGRPIPWEACVTMNNNWGYCSTDKLFKSPKLLIRKLVECVSKNGNLLLNIGPDAKGLIPEESLAIMNEIGSWMRLNGDSIYGCASAGLDKPDWGYYTRKGQRLFAHVFDGNIGSLPLTGLCGKARSARRLADASEMRFSHSWNHAEYPKDLFLNFGPNDTFTYPLPDDKDTVVELDMLP
ncbi:MAG: alpha-L-fucosidase [Clostridiaceae bacterium]|nr:alpha-L-fucosidase [Clostridiaceae bacterium]